MHCFKASFVSVISNNEKNKSMTLKLSLSSQCTLTYLTYLTLLYQLSVTKTNEKNKSLTTDTKVASYQASYKDPLTRKIGLYKSCIFGSGNICSVKGPLLL